MFEIANIREWRGHDVVDVGGHKIGELEAVYVDTSTDLPSFGTILVGMPTRHRLVFVPLNGATVGPGYLKVTYDRKQVKNAPLATTDFFDTGVELITDKPAAGVTSIDSAAGLKKCWG